MMKNIKTYRILPFLLSVLIALVSLNCAKNIKMWKKQNIIAWDVISYYAYLPATFIYNDYSLKFMDDYKGPHEFTFWPRTIENGSKIIETSMGMSILYAPFFFAAHAYALNSDYDPGGYSVPYHVAIRLCCVFYFLIGLIFLSKLLLKFFNPYVSSLALLMTSVGSNLFFYATYASGMSHQYNFALITMFIWFTIKWHESPKMRYSVILGLLIGLISLIRPTNIIVSLFFIFYGIINWRDFREQYQLFIAKYKHILAIIVLCFLVWLPQLLYWKSLTGSFLFFSSGEGNRFFFNNPQILKGFLSYRNGWLVYSPVMIFSVFGIFVLWKNHKKWQLPVVVTFLVFVYVIFSWWCWWYGGSFGSRAMIDIYGLLAFTAAAFISYIANLKLKWISYPVIMFAILLTLVGLHHLDKRMGQSFHYDSMTKEAFWDNYLRRGPTATYWEKLRKPDYIKATQGIDAVMEPERSNE
jgi:hypothetical protein